MTHNRIIIIMVLFSCLMFGLSACSSLSDFRLTHGQKQTVVKVAKYAFSMLLDEFLRANIGIDFTSARSDAGMIMQRHGDMAYIFRQDDKGKWRLKSVTEYATLEALMGAKRGNISK